jgi:putative heme iron utilization protein
MQQDEKARAARRLLRSQPFGVLATHSLDVPGYPFGSITPYVLDRGGNPLILISTLAQHTKNIVANPHVSLTVWEQSDAVDQQSVGRLTWIGDAAVADTDSEDARARYLRYIPSAAGHFQMHDFALYRISLKRARYIGGFGAIFWVEPDQMHLENPLEAATDGILTHMNDDHSAALVRYCKALKNVDAKSAQMVGIDPEGFDVLADGRRVRIDFESPVTTPEQVRAAMVKLSRATSG